MKYGVKSKTYSRYLEEFGSYGEARVFTLKLREVWNNATMQIYEIDGLQEDILVEQFSPTKGTNYNKTTTMKSKQNVSEHFTGCARNPSYDTSLSVGERLSDYMGKFHIVLHGVRAHEPYYLDCENRPDERCDDKEKKDLIEFVALLIADERERVTDRVKDWRRGMYMLGREVDTLNRAHEQILKVLTRLASPDKLQVDKEL